MVAPRATVESAMLRVAIACDYFSITGVRLSGFRNPQQWAITGQVP